MIFTGLVPDDDLPAIYALGGLFVMPSRQNLAQHSAEGFGLLYLEANACGKPAGSSRSGTIATTATVGSAEARRKDTGRHRGGDGHAAALPADAPAPRHPLPKPSSGCYHLIRFIRSEGRLDVSARNFLCPRRRFTSSCGPQWMLKPSAWACTSMGGSSTTSASIACANPARAGRCRSSPSRLFLQLRNSLPEIPDA